MKGNVFLTEWNLVLTEWHLCYFACFLWLIAQNNCNALCVRK